MTGGADDDGPLTTEEYEWAANFFSQAQEQFTRSKPIALAAIAEAALLIAANVMRPGLLEAQLDAADLLPGNIPDVAASIREALTWMGD